MSKKNINKIPEEKTRVTVEIFGSTYVLKTTSDPEKVIKLARFVDGQLTKIAREHPGLPLLKVAVLASLNLAEEYSKLSDDYAELMKMIKAESK